MSDNDQYNDKNYSLLLEAQSLAFKLQSLLADVPGDREYAERYSRLAELHKRAWMRVKRRLAVVKDTKESE